MIKRLRVLDIAGAQLQVFETPPLACEAAASDIRQAIRISVEATGKAVLGLATGRTPEQVYAHLVAWHRAGSLSFQGVSTYNLDEYYPIGPLDPASYRAYMHRHLFGHVDLAPNRAHVLDGTVPEAFAADHCAQFDRWIAAEGGMTSNSSGSAGTVTSASTSRRICPSNAPSACRPAWSNSTR